MHLASDYIHPTPRGGQCRIRIYLPEEHDALVVICSELPSNESSSVTYSAHQTELLQISLLNLLCYFGFSALSIRAATRPELSISKRLRQPG
jgi:hypothetical protein